MDPTATTLWPSLEEHAIASSTDDSNAAVPKSVRVVHVITSLNVGGAERALLRLLQQPAGEFESVAVINLVGRGALARDVEAAGVPVFDVGLRSLMGAPGAVRRIHRLLRHLQPDVVHTWMHHADLVGGLAARAARVPAVAWNLRASNLPSDGYSRSTRALVRVNARLSRWIPDVITCVAEAARRDHQAIGYAASKMVVVPNGVPCPEMSSTAREELRRELGVEAGVILVGRVARFHPMKDYRTLIRAAGILRETHREVEWLLCGRDVTWDNAELASWIDRAGVGDRVHLLGPRTDVDRIYAALDLACSSSAHSEGFPNVVAEAMAAGLPVVTTDVGDSAVIVGDTGRVVPPRDPESLAAAVADLADDPALRARLGRAARSRVLDEFGLERMVERYSAVYASIV